MGKLVLLKIINWILIVIGLLSLVSSIIVLDQSSILSIPFLLLIIIQSVWCLSLIKKVK